MMIMSEDIGATSAQRIN